MEYNLEERTVKFSRDLLTLCASVKPNMVNENMLKQVLRSGTSVGANYCEANGATSRTDFKAKIHICKKEAKETMYWLRLLASIVGPETKNKIQILWNENKELTLIFSKIALSSKN
ncbi:four helix bundle protein [Candidatus Shapirobacteria bacterium CG_4_9_14_3_um_filter_36_12]|uniref:Four helix bundle protein n=2 Tax=Candidatus Shapironibacteriota TaxID=1752721 RepID=A0A1J5HTT2_9BACT|nr:MAG: hypothetical protein AUK05_00280 [Candidatus Shapirobacteria bacterium CG2_30_35_20]PJA50795.1 MAG: four helix bundle protein [Candidatus Shapirobacteria bacterium CG_4_9_14_3_um_filter_36_12]